jgi:hypothetical protein
MTDLFPEKGTTLTELTAEKRYEKARAHAAKAFCAAPHPTAPPGADTWCTRRPGHDGEHAAFTFSISTPETW